MASLAAELSSVLQEAISALEQEDSNDLAAAIDTYYKLQSQLKYVLDMKIDPTQDGPLATVCRGLAESYDIRIQASEGTCMHPESKHVHACASASSIPNQIKRLHCCRSSEKSNCSKLYLAQLMLVNGSNWMETTPCTSLW